MYKLFLVINMSVSVKKTETAMCIGPPRMIKWSPLPVSLILVAVNGLSSE